MKLHRIQGQPEWENIDGKHHNRWQAVAARSNGILTTGNALTIAGLLIALYGISAILEQHYWTGLWAITAGRLFDVADGYSADLTGTKSPIGEALDAACDKLITALMLAALFAAQLAPWYVLVLLLLPHVIIAGLSLIAVARGSRLHPSRAGKLSMACAWGGLIGLILLKALGYDDINPLSVLVYACLAMSFCLGIWAVTGYGRPTRD